VQGAGAMFQRGSGAIAYFAEHRFFHGAANLQCLDGGPQAGSGPPASRLPGAAAATSPRRQSGARTVNHIHS